MATQYDHTYLTFITEISLVSPCFFLSMVDLRLQRLQRLLTITIIEGKKNVLTFVYGISFHMSTLKFSHLSAHDQRFALGLYYYYINCQTLPSSDYLLFFFGLCMLLCFDLLGSHLVSRITFQQFIVISILFLFFKVLELAVLFLFFCLRDSSISDMTHQKQKGVTF